MIKNYMVVHLPTNGHPVMSNPHADFDTAFEQFNQFVALSTEQLFNRPKREQPLRASLADGDVELWIISRTTDLITN